jgi:U2 small nuclear ribonucleoprotein B''
VHPAPLPKRSQRLSDARAVMKQTLRALFKTYGDVLDVVAHKNLRMRGQAFVSFPDAELAAKARREVNAFPLYGKPMVRLCLRTKSDMG